MYENMSIMDMKMKTIVYGLTIIFGVLFTGLSIQEGYAESIDELIKEYDLLIDKFDKIGTNTEQLTITQELIDEINSDLKRFETIVVTLQNHGYDGMGGVELIDGQMVGTVSFFEKYTLEPLFKRQIPSGTINIFGMMGLLKEFETNDTSFSYEQKVELLKSSSALIGTVASFRDSSDPNDEISSQMILGAIAAYHPSENNMKNSELSLLSSDQIPSLKLQEKSGISPLDVVCKEGLQKVLKSSDKSPACVKPSTAEKLIKRGWAFS